jgi:hypothetical protein
MKVVLKMGMRTKFNIYVFIIVVFNRVTMVYTHVFYWLGSILNQAIKSQTAYRGGYRGRTRHPPPPPPPPPKIGKNMIFWRKSGFFTRNTPKIFAPPSARPNLFKCTHPLTWNPGSAPCIEYLLISYSNRKYYYNLPKQVTTIQCIYPTGSRNDTRLC